MYAHATHIAIDVGTARTSAAVAVVTEEDIEVRAIRLGQSGDTASSAVYVADDGLVFGDAAERRGVADPARLLRETKRRMGDDVPLIAGGRSFTAARVHAATVAWALGAVTAQESDPVASITVTVPSAWGAHRLRAVSEALAELDISAALVSEPVAAAAHYAASRDVPTGSVLAVYDFGGGTFDLAFVRHADDGDAVIHTAGVAELGGADFDDAVFAHVVQALPDGATVGSDPMALSLLRRECVAAKEALSFDPEASIPVVHCGTSIRLVRAEFEGMIDDDIARTVDVFARAKDEAGITDADIHAILLSGGSSRIPHVVQMLSDAFDLPLRADTDPKAVVALGAARWGAMKAHPVAAVPTAVVTATPVALPSKWRIAVAATAACTTILGGAALTSSLAAALPETVVAAAAGDPETLLDSFGTWRTSPFDPALGAASAPDTSMPEAPSDQPAEPGPAPAPTIPKSGPPPVQIPKAPKSTKPAAPSTPSTRAAAPSTSPSTGTSPAGGGSGGGPAGAPPSGSGTQPATTTVPQPTTAPEPEPTVGPEPTTEPEPQPTTDPQPEPTTDPEPQPTTEPEPSTEPEPQPTTEPEPAPEPTPDPEPSPNIPLAE